MISYFKMGVLNEKRCKRKRKKKSQGKTRNQEYSPEKDINQN